MFSIQNQRIENTKKKCKAAPPGFRLACAARSMLLQLLLALPAGAQAEFFYTTNNGRITITGYSGFTDIRKYKPRSEVVAIPDTINGLPVVSIGDRAFYDHYDLISVTIPNSMTSIGSCAFQSCASLTNVTIPNSVTSIGFGAFSGCRLTKITIPQSVTNIGDVAFSSCVTLEAITVDSLNPVYRSVDGVLINKSQATLIKCPGGKAGSYTVPNGVTTIGDTAFSESTLLTSVTLPDSVTKIQWHAFMSCTALTNVMIGKNVTSIGGDSGWLTFKDCPSLTGITVDALNPVYRSVDGVLIDKSKTTLIKCPEGKAGSYPVPNNVTKIEAHAFSGSTHLTSVTIPDSVNSIEDNAFESCVGLASVTMGKNVKSIGNSAFASCTNLTSITIPDNVAAIGEGAFYSCSSLTNVMIGKNVTRIGKAAFSSCSSLLAITVDALNPTHGSKNGVLFNKHQTLLTVSINEPANGASINAMCVDVHGTVAGKNLKTITVENPSANMGIPALVSRNKFEARNVFLRPGANTISAVAEDIAGNTGTNTITIIGPTDTNIARMLPVGVQITPSGGFAPLAVTFTVHAHVPGKLQKVFYDFNGDNIADQINSELQPVTHTYKAGGEYFPVVTIQTSVGRFSSLSGMLAMFGAAFGGSGASFVNVQLPPVVLSTIKITDPVAIKWTATSNLYVLSGSTATITEFDPHGETVRSKNRIGSNPSGFALDAAGNVYVALTGNNQVRKFKPTSDSFEADPSFGFGGFIGDKDGLSGAKSNQFNAPFDVAISRDGQTIAVSDSGNQRLQQFALNGTLTSSSEVEGGLRHQLKAPKGLAHDEIGIYLFIVDSGNNRIVLADTMIGFNPVGTSGTNGAALGQFNGAMHLAANKRALYVADTGNNRVQVFKHVEGGEMHSPTPFNPRVALSGELGLDHPKSVAAVDDLLEEKFYIADTGNNRVILIKLPSDNPEAVWNDLMARLKAGDTEGAISHFSITSKDKYRDAFLALPKDELRSMVKDMENIKPVTIESDHAQYHFESMVDGKTLTFPVAFNKEFGQWKIVEY